MSLFTMHNCTKVVVFILFQNFLVEFYSRFFFNLVLIFRLFCACYVLNWITDTVAFKKKRRKSESQIFLFLWFSGWSTDLHLMQRELWINIISLQCPVVFITLRDNFNLEIKKNILQFKSAQNQVLKIN